jgi:hypothetical protein
MFAPLKKNLLERKSSSQDGEAQLTAEGIKIVPTTEKMSMLKMPDAESILRQIDEDCAKE